MPRRSRPVVPTVRNPDVLIVDAATAVHTRPAAGLVACGYSVHVTNDAAQVLQRFEPRILIVDLFSCGQLLVDAEHHARAGGITCVAMTDTPGSMFAQALLAAGMRVLEKPLGLRELIISVERTLNSAGASSDRHAVF
jgi:DNA-binding response OmpR family regulator